MLDGDFRASEVARIVASGQRHIRSEVGAGGGALRTGLQPALGPTDKQFCEFCPVNRKLRIERGCRREPGASGVRQKEAWFCRPVGAARCFAFRFVFDGRNPFASGLDMEIEPCPVVPIPARFDAREIRGTRTKFWVQIEEGTDRWLFKIPRRNTGEHWAEKVAAEIGCLVGVECAQVELARYVDEGGLEYGLHGLDEQEVEQPEPPSWLGTVCKSFVPDVQLEDEERYLFHGWEVLQWAVENYDTNLRFGQRDHNIKNIIIALTDLMGANTGNPTPHWDHVLEELVSYALLDGLIGNTDRHHENWMIALVVYSGDMRIEVYAVI